MWRVSECFVYKYCLEANAKIVSEEHGLQDICRAMDTHSNISDLIEAACSALWSLSMEGLISA